VFDWAEMPRVPAPRAGTYAQAAGVPTDPGIAQLVAGHRYDASLAGAAAGIALDLATDRGGLTAPELREAAWRAGWPYPITSAQVWVGSAGQPPPQPVLTWIAEQAGSLGLVRVRAGVEEAWVGLGAAPRADVGVVPRQLPAGGTLTLPALPGLRALVADPSGTLTEGELHTTWTTTTDETGEWLVEVRDERGQVALFPIYVGLVPPELDLLIPTEPPLDDAAAVAMAREVFAEVREAYGLRPLGADPILDAVARSWQSDPAMPVADVARLAGTDPARTWRWECRGSSMESCVDSIVWDVRARQGLLLDEVLWGLTAQVGPNGVHVVAAVGAP
jgi:hypothetical protein